MYNATDTTKSEFEAIKPADRLFSHENARRFATIQLQTRRVGFSWRSDGIDPLIRLVTSHKTPWIGVDERVAAIKLTDDQPILLLPLGGSLLQLELLPTAVAALAETEAFLFNYDGSLRAYAALPDLPERLTTRHNEVFVELTDGRVLPLRTRSEHRRDVTE